MTFYLLTFDDEGLLETAKEVAREELPEEVQEMFRKRSINYIEEGMSASLEQFRGYTFRNGELIQQTGTSWRWFPNGVAYARSKAVVKALIKELKEKKGVKQS